MMILPFHLGLDSFQPWFTSPERKWDGDADFNRLGNLLEYDFVETNFPLKLREGNCASSTRRLSFLLQTCSQ